MANPDSSRETRIPARSVSLSSTIRILSATSLPHGNLDDEERSLSGVALEVYDPAVRVHDFLGQRKTDPGAGLLGGEEGHEDLVPDLQRDPRAVVADCDPDEL